MDEVVGLDEYGKTFLGDIRALIDAGLLNDSSSQISTILFNVSPIGYKYYEYLMQVQEKPGVRYGKDGLEKEKNLLSTKEAAKRIGLSQRTIRRLCRRGELSGTVKDERGNWLIPEESLIQYISHKKDNHLERFLLYVQRLQSLPVWQLLLLIIGAVTLVATFIGLAVDLPDFIKYFSPSQEEIAAVSVVSTATSTQDLSTNPSLVITSSLELESVSEANSLFSVPATKAAPTAVMSETTPSPTLADASVMSTEAKSPPTEWLVTPDPNQNELPTFEKASWSARGQKFNDYVIQPVVIPDPSDPDSGALILSHIAIFRGNESWELEGCENGNFSRTGRLALICGSNLYLADEYGGNRSGSLQPISIEVLNLNWSPIWNPDGTAVTFIGCRGLECALYEQTIGEDPVQISPMARRNGWALLGSYSDDGAWVQYNHVDIPCEEFEIALNIESGFSLCLS